jgi:hypothetical protein
MSIAFSEKRHLCVGAFVQRAEIADQIRFAPQPGKLLAKRRDRFGTGFDFPSCQGQQVYEKCKTPNDGASINLGAESTCWSNL